MSSPQIFASILAPNMMKSAFVKTTRIFWSEQHGEGNGWGIHGSCLPAAGQARTCVCVSPWLWEAPIALLTIRALKGSSSAQAVGTLSGFKAEALVRLSSSYQHSTVISKAPVLRGRHDKVASTELLRGTAAA